MAQPTARIEGTKLIVTIDMEDEPRPSGSGKTLLLASSGGSPATGLIHPGTKRPIYVQLSAYVKRTKGEMVSEETEAGDEPAPAEAPKAEVKKKGK